MNVALSLICIVVISLNSVTTNFSCKVKFKPNPQTKVVENSSLRFRFQTPPVKESHVTEESGVGDYPCL